MWPFMSKSRLILWNSWDNHWTSLYVYCSSVERQIHLWDWYELDRGLIVLSWQKHTKYIFSTSNSLKSYGPFQRRDCCWFQPPTYPKELEVVKPPQLIFQRRHLVQFYWNITMQNVLHLSFSFISYNALLWYLGVEMLLLVNWNASECK